jgi:hypothetical protein
VRAAANRLVELVQAKDVAALRAMIDPELGRRLEVASQHARAKPIDQFPLLQKAEKEMADPGWVALKREEIVQRLLRGLAQQCAFLGEPELRTPRWPKKKREGWGFILATAAMTEHVFDAYAQCKMGLNVEVRFARRPGQAEWKAVAAGELPFGQSRPAEPYVPRWDG